MAENIFVLSQEQKLSQIWDLDRNTANMINFYYRSNSVKINDQIFQWIEKNMFLAHFGPFSQFFGKKIFLSENPALSCTTSYEFLAPCQISVKTYDTIPRKYLDKRMMEERKDGQTLFHWTLPATAVGPETDWYKDTQMDAKNKEKNLKNQHCLLSMLVTQIEYLYYSLNVEGVTQKGSLLPARIR